MKLLPKEGKKKKEKNKNVKAEKRRFPLNSYNSLTGSSGSSRYPRLAGGCPAPPCLCTRLSERRFALKSQEFKARNTLGSLCQLGHPLGTAETQFPFFLRFIICCRKVAGGGGGSHTLRPLGAGGGPAKPGLFLGGGWPGRSRQGARGRVPRIPLLWGQGAPGNMQPELGSIQGPSAGATPGRGDGGRQRGGVPGDSRNVAGLW